MVWCDRGKQRETALPLQPNKIIRGSQQRSGEKGDKNVLDFSKVFDKVLQKRPLRNHGRYGVRGKEICYRLGTG